MRQKKTHGSSQKRIDDLFDYQLPDRVPIGSMSLGFNAINAGYRVREVL